MLAIYPDDSLFPGQQGSGREGKEDVNTQEKDEIKGTSVLSLQTRTQEGTLVFL